MRRAGQSPSSGEGLCSCLWNGAKLLQKAQDLERVMERIQLQYFTRFGEFPYPCLDRGLSCLDSLRQSSCICFIYCALIWFNPRLVLPRSRHKTTSDERKNSGVSEAKPAGCTASKKVLQRDLPRTRWQGNSKGLTKREKLIPKHENSKLCCD
jgi:hypothetical protein